RGALQVIRRQPCEIAGPLRLPWRAPEGGAPAAVALRAFALLERGVNGGARELDRATREHEHDPEVLRKREWSQRGAVPLAELRSLGEKEGHVGADLRGELIQPGGRQRFLEGLVGKAQGRGRIGAAAP